MKVGKMIGRLFHRNEIIALWKQTDRGFKSLLWRGAAHNIPDEYKGLRVKRFFGTIPESIAQADALNLLLAGSEIKVCCITCEKNGTMECPNSSTCMVTVDKPHWEWDQILTRR